MKDELQTFLNFWDAEAEKSVAVMRALPADGYDFRPDPAGRCLGELAWHLAEADGYTTYGIEQGTFTIRRETAGHRTTEIAGGVGTQRTNEFMPRLCNGFDTWVQRIWIGSSGTSQRMNYRSASFSGAPSSST
jgi:hypothetical protein